jgi:hypothetical protein
MDEKKVDKLGRKVLNAFTRRITDEVFLFIERNPEFLKEYQNLVKEFSAHGVNAALGKMITEAYGLENDGKETRPDCPLLKKYSRHKLDWDKRKKNVAITPQAKLYGDGNLFTPKKKKRRPAPKKEQPKITHKPEEDRQGSLFEETNLFPGTKKDGDEDAGR